MITVKFFGSVRVDYGLKELMVHAGTIAEAVEEIRKHSSIDEQELRQSIIFVNNKQVTGIRQPFAFSLNDGDELVFLSPISGG